MDQSLLLFLGAILIVGGLLLVFITITRKGPRLLDIDRYRSQWMTIETSLHRDEVASHSLAVINADKLVDKALQERAFKGQTMGERMKSAQKTWSKANDVWSAHKLRNKIAHDNNVSVSYDQARQALAKFKQALKDLGAI